MDKIYFSKALDPTKWSSDSDFLTFYIVPNKWWSLKDWRLANSIRASMLKNMMQFIKDSNEP